MKGFGMCRRGLPTNCPCFKEHFFASSEQQKGAVCPVRSSSLGAPGFSIHLLPFQEHPAKFPHSPFCFILPQMLSSGLGP